MKKLSNEEMKGVMTQILVHFADFCYKNNLVYYLHYGTLIGALRHKGFIPWDDDIDVCMPRPDYELFIKLYNLENENKRYKLLSLESNNSPYPFAKLEDTKTVIVNSRSKLHQSLWIDIFPVDGIDIESGKMSNIHKKRFHLGKMLEIACITKNKGNIIARLIKSIVVLYAKLRGSYYYGKKISQLAQLFDYSKCNYIGNLVWGYGEKDAVKKSDIFPLRKVEFENHEFYAPLNDKLLQQIYGDYMRLPPVEQRINHNTQASLID